MTTHRRTSRRLMLAVLLLVLGASTMTSSDKQSNGSQPPESDPLRLGTVRPVSDVQASLTAKVAETIPHDPANSSYPDEFSSYIDYQLDYYPKGYVLVLPDGARLTSDLVLDWDTDWVRGERIVAVACEGDFTIEGDIVNHTLEGGPLLLVAGNLRVRHVKKGGASFIVLGDVHAEGWVIGEYNDGVIRINGDLDANVFLLLDHDGFVRGEKRARVLSLDEVDEWGEIMVQEVLDDPEDPDSSPEADKIWERLKKGLPVLRD